VPVSLHGGIRPTWSPDGGTLYYLADLRMMSAAITDSPALAVTRRDSLFVANVVAEDGGLAVLPGGRGFVAALGREARSVNRFRLAVLSNWQSLLAAPAGGRP
jgi:hypothetical protein